MIQFFKKKTFNILHGLTSLNMAHTVDQYLNTIFSMFVKHSRNIDF